MNYFVTGIDTEIGKTIVSAVLVEALGYNYWKPVQSGELDNSDTMKVQRLVTSKVDFYPETHRLTNPLSPHLSAKMDGVNIEMEDFKLPLDDHLVIEGAGGLLVPINEKGDYIADLIPNCKAEVILVSKNYLGSINHTLLSIDYLQKRNIPIKGIIITGNENPETEAIILKNTGVKVLFHVPWAEQIDQKFIAEQAEVLRGILTD